MALYDAGRAGAAVAPLLERRVATSADPGIDRHRRASASTARTWTAGTGLPSRPAEDE